MFTSELKVTKASISLISIVTDYLTLESVPIVLFSDTLKLQKDFPMQNHDNVLGYIHYLRGEVSNKIDKSSFSINIKIGMPLPLSAVTLSHECGHLKALLKNPLDGSEVSAWEYAYKLLKKLKKWEQYVLYPYFVKNDPTCTYFSSYKKVSIVEAFFSYILNK